MEVGYYKTVVTSRIRCPNKLKVSYAIDCSGPDMVSHPIRKKVFLRSKWDQIWNTEAFLKINLDRKVIFVIRGKRRYNSRKYMGER